MLRLFHAILVQEDQVTLLKLVENVSASNNQFSRAGYQL